MGALTASIVASAVVAGAIAGSVWRSPAGCCTRSSAQSALGITVRDAATTAFICDARVTFQDGDWFEEAAPLRNATDGSCLYHGAIERAGTYRVTVSRRGFVTKSMDDVEVDSTTCSVEPRGVTIAIEREPNAPPEDFLPIDAGVDGQ
jgi:hypothetical protein